MRIQRNIIAQITAILPANLSYFIAGIGCGWLPPILNKYKNSDSDFSLSTQDCSLIASLHYVGKGVACLLTLALIDRIGRNAIFIFNAISGLFIWLAVLATKSIPLHLAIRLLFGLSTGAADMAIPIYVGENSSPQLRGIFGVLCIIFFYAGELVAFFVATYFSYTTIALIFLALTVASGLSTLWLREPGQYLLAQGREARAADNFFALRGTSEAAKREFLETKQALQQPQGPRHFSFQLLTNRSIRVVIVINLLMYLTGYSPINSMSSLAFQPIGSVSPNELTIILGFGQLLSVTLSSAIIERFGRRPLLMGSTAVCILFHLVSSAVYFFNEGGTPLPFASWLLFIFITGYCLVLAAIILPLCTVIRGELLAPQLKPIGGCLSVVLNSMVSVAMTSSFLIVAETYGMKANFLFFAAMSAVMFAYVCVDLPETKGLTLTEIQKALHENTNL